VCVSVAKDGCILSKRKLKQDDVPAHTAHSTQNWMRVNCPDFLAKHQWLRNSPHLNPLDCQDVMWGAMLEACHKHKTKSKIIAELKSALQVIWDNLPQGSFDKAVKDFSKRLKACVEAGGGHFDNSQ